MIFGPQCISGCVYKHMEDKPVGFQASFALMGLSLFSSRYTSPTDCYKMYGVPRVTIQAQERYLILVLLE